MRNIGNLIILTDPMPIGKYFLTENLKVIIRFLLNIFRKKAYYRDEFYRGHFAVTKSLIIGMKNLGYKFYYNPKCLCQNNNIVIVLAGIETLRQAIELKKRGKIKYLFAGPNIVTFSTDSNSIISSSQIDLIIVNSDWIAKLYYTGNNSIGNRFIIWPAGVDYNFWKPIESKITNRILIYNKLKSDNDHLEPYVKFLTNSGYVVKILNYGSFTKEVYLEELQKATIMIGFPNKSESQGIAWAEAWSCDVPLFVQNNKINTINGVTFECSTAPYLNQFNGVFFNDFNDFIIVFKKWLNGKFDFQPRNWVLNHATYEVTAKKLVTDIENYIISKNSG